MTRSEAFNLAKTPLDAVFYMFDLNSRHVAEIVGCDQSVIRRIRKGSSPGEKNTWAGILRAVNLLTHRDFTLEDFIDPQLIGKRGVKRDPSRGLRWRKPDPKGGRTNA